LFFKIFSSNLIIDPNKVIPLIKLDPPLEGGKKRRIFPEMAEMPRGEIPVTPIFPARAKKNYREEGYKGFDFYFSSFYGICHGNYIAGGGLPGVPQLPGDKA